MKRLSVTQEKQVHFGSEVDDGNSGTSKAIDWRLGNYHKLTMTGACTLTWTDPSGPCHLTLRCIQDGTGGRTLALPTCKKRNGTAIVLSTGIAAEDILSFYFNGSAYYAQIGAFS